MDREDGRRLSGAVQEERRKIIIRMKKQGKSVVEITETVGLSRGTVYNAWRRYQDGGVKALANKRRGRRHGEKRHLSADREKAIRRMIIDKHPDQLKLDFALWTREAVRQLIESQYGIRMPIRTVGEYLRRWGFTPQKPAKFAYERKPEAVKQWLDKRYPEIRDRADAEQAEIYWGDETGLRAGDVRGRSFAPVGKRPAVTVTAKHENLSMVSAITNKGKVCWMITEGAVNAERFTEFLERLLRGAPRKVFLILDNLRVHHSYVVNDWIEEHKEAIELFFLPSYSPDLNPDEHLNADLKQGVGQKAPTRTKATLRVAADSHMRLLEISPERIRKYFKDPVISYAAV